MSLLRLLKTGKSLVGLEEDGRRYQPAGARLLPKFASKKNPFRSTTKTSVKPADPEALASVAVANPQPEVSPAKRVGPPSFLSRCLAKFKGWASQSTAWFGRGKRSKSAIPHFSKLALQTVLSLDSVRVMRNDLSDADFELVPARPAAKSNPPPAKASVPDQANGQAVEPARPSTSDATEPAGAGRP